MAVITSKLTTHRPKISAKTKLKCDAEGLNETSGQRQGPDVNQQAPAPAGWSVVMRSGQGRRVAGETCIDEKDLRLKS